MLTQQALSEILRQIDRHVQELFPEGNPETILFGSYARGDADSDSDIDLMILLDVPRASIADNNWRMGEIAADLLLEHGIVISPILENREFFNDNMEALPFFRNIHREGGRFVA